MGKTSQFLVNRVGSDLQYLGQSPGPVQNLYCAQKELVGQASVRVLMRSLGLANPGIQAATDSCREQVFTQEDLQFSWAGEAAGVFRAPPSKNNGNYIPLLCPWQAGADS